VALVLTEPAMTNRVHLLAPEPGWHDALRTQTRRHGTLLAVDETHTHVVGPGGATGLWGLDPDVVTIGKAVAGGVPMGAYGSRPRWARSSRSCGTSPPAGRCSATRCRPRPPGPR
jgi:glutamate-1-semialdehyde 2,1-aminomutase